MRFINPKRQSYHHALISEFSDTSRFMTSGSVKGFVQERYAWFADFMNKFNNNVSFNPNIAYVSFFSDHDVFISEYANVSRLTDEYEIILDIADKTLGYSHELSTKQYSKIAQRHSSFDVIEFINQSELVNDPSGTISRTHSFYFAPVIYETGYKVNKDALTPAQTGYDMFLWSQRRYNPLTIKDYGFSVVMSAWGADCNAAVFNIINGVSGDTTRLLDCKVVPTEISWGFNDSESRSKVHYPYELNDDEPWSYHSSIGFPLFYKKSSAGQFSEMHGFDELMYSYMFPQILFNDVIERQKNIFFATSDLPEGRVFFHAAGLSNEEDDQSQIIFNICRNMVYDAGTGDYRIGQKTYNDVNTIQGVDIDVERNRRYSAVVTADPYMRVRPVNNGQVVQYKFIRSNGGNFSSTDFPTTYRYMSLKLKAPRQFMRALDRELEKHELNTDILHTLYIINPINEFMVSSTGDYDRFRGSGTPNLFYRRMEYCTDDLVDGIVGIGSRYVFWTNWTGMPTYYTDSMAKICGIGHYVETGADGVPVEYAKLYCSNYVPINPVSNKERTFSFAEDHLSQIEENEVFRPMLRVPGIQGYVKIIKRSAGFEPVVLSDGDEEIVYDIEFPYCPGSFKERYYYATEYKHTQIFYKSSYINAGSWKKDTNNHYDSYNSRYAPENDKAFSRIDVYKSRDYNNTEILNTDPEILGGESFSTTARPDKLLSYPAYLCFERDYGLDGLKFISLTKPRDLPGYETFGTFDMTFGSPLSSPYLHFTTDFKMPWNVDNRVWKFGENKFSSYINREYPSYVFEIDAGELLNEFGRNQYKYAGIPDIKRWIFAKASAFCSTIHNPETESSEDYPDGTHDVATQNSNSDIVIEIWDNAFPIGSDTRPMWRPFSSTVYDNNKYTSKTLVSGLHSILSKIPVFVTDNLYFVILEKFNSSTFDYGLTEDEILSVDAQSNLVMYDSVTGKMYHVAHVVQDNVDPDNVQLKVYFICDPSDSITNGDGIAVDIYNWVGPVSLHKPYSKLTRKTDFEFKSCESVFSDTELNTFLRTRYLDFGNKTSGDFSRYVNGENKIYIRIRPLKARTYPVAYNKDSSDLMQYIGERVAGSVVNEYTNMPWYTMTAYDIPFDWSKVDIVEYIYKFGLSYFSLNSK